MYVDHFGFKEKPFKLKPDARFFFSTAALTNTAMALDNAIANRQAVILLTGLAGSGKTSLLRRTIEKLTADNPSTDSRIISLGNPTLPFTGMIEQLVERLGFGNAGQSLAAQINALQNGLDTAVKSGLPIVVAIDDAHVMERSVLQDLIGLGHDDDGMPLWILLLAGLPETGNRLNTDHAVLMIDLEPLTDADISPYIDHQLTAAGATTVSIFTPNSIEMIAELTHGNPRTINSLCDAGLFIAAMEGQTIITPEIIERAAQQCFLKDPERINYFDSAVSTKPAATPIPLQPTPLTGLTDSGARAALGLRFGDVSQEIAATVPADELPNPFAEPGSAHNSTTPSHRLTVTAEAALDEATILLPASADTELTDSPPVVAQQLESIDEDLRLPNEGLPYDDAGQSSYSALDDPLLSPRKRRRFGWLGMLAKLLVLVMILTAIVWFKPEWLGLSDTQVRGYIDTLRSKVSRLITTVPTAAPNLTAAPLASSRTTDVATTPAAAILQTIAPSTNSSPTIAPAVVTTATTVPASIVTSPDDPDSTSLTVAPIAQQNTETAIDQRLNKPVASSHLTNDNDMANDMQAIIKPLSNNPPTLTTATAATSAKLTAISANDTASAVAITTDTDNRYFNNLLAETQTTTTVSSNVLQHNQLQLSQIDALLAGAEEQIAADLLTTPPGNNAYDSYRKVLTLQPDNALALAGIETIKQTYQVWAQAATRRGAIDRARQYYQKALRVDPQDNSIKTAIEQLDSP